jgi:hypothetical protein
MAFDNSINKDAVRARWDMAILERWAARRERRLSYFGLPGPAILDVLCWRSLLDGRWTAVEERARSGEKRDLADRAATLLQTNALVNNLSAGLQVLRGDIGEVILRAEDDFQTRPILCDDAPSHEAKFTYDVVNLDFDGGLGFKAKSGARRVEALKELFHRQRGHSFLLFLTINVRDTLGTEVDDYLRSLEADVDPELVNWYRDRGKGEYEYKLKSVVPVFLLTAAEVHGFDVICHPPLVYTGHASARMVHFVLELSWKSQIFPAVSRQRASDLLKLPLVEVADGKIRLASKQHPSWSPQAAQERLAFMPDRLIPELFSEEVAA